MKKVKSKPVKSQPYYVGAEIYVDKQREGEENFDAKLVKFGARFKQAMAWLMSFPPLNTPQGDEIKRVVLRLPIGYRERRDIIRQYKERRKDLNHENARFAMLSDHAGPANTFVYVEGSRSHIDQPQAQQPKIVPGVHEDAVLPVVGNEDGSEVQRDDGSVKLVSEDE